jgi:hypothetical protein
LQDARRDPQRAAISSQRGRGGEPAMPSDFGKKGSWQRFTRSISARSLPHLRKLVVIPDAVIWDVQPWRAPQSA